MTRRRVFWSLICVLSAVLGACTKKDARPEVVVEIPAGFSGNFLLEMGTRNAPPLPLEHGKYVVAVPRGGKLTTSTFLEKPKITFKNASEGSVWGYSQSVFTTGDGISIGGKVEFFVGTKTQFEAEQNKRNHSGSSPFRIEPDFAS